ncbi:NADP-specific glutamate dehydrogenase, partial [bacterium]|nr:NADP-specific glutamate dehydrogenase [bacterium]
VNLGILKFLAFEQVLKNSLTTLPMGGGKGGSDFDPKGKSDTEVMSFCQSFMTELCRHIGQFTDVPAGDIGVGGREIGFMYGQYKRVKNEFVGVLTGKGLNWGGSLIRPEATGYGAVYFAAEMLQTRGESLEGKACLVSGGGNVAQYTTEKILDLGGKVLTLSDSGGYIYDEEGIDREKLAFVMELKNVKRGRIKEYADKYKGAVYTPVDKALDYNPLWNHKADCAFPSATQNEINAKDAQNLVDNGVYVVSEGANMPTVPDGVEIFLAKKILYGPGKAANAGGVSVSGLEMSQNSMRYSWSREEVDQKLHSIMKAIHKAAFETAEEFGTPGNYVNGANIAGFLKVADSMMDMGSVG